jgi:hypothetical protein
MEQKPYDHAFQYKDIPSVAETFADGLHLLTVDATTARMTLTVSRGDEPKPNYKGPPTGQKATAARIVMPVPALLNLYNQLSQLVMGLEAQGLIRREGEKLTVQ